MKTSCNTGFHQLNLALVNTITGANTGQLIFFNQGEIYFQENSQVTSFTIMMGNWT